MSAWRGLLVGTGLWLVACDPPAVAPPSEPPDPVEVRAAVDRAVATTGDLISYTIEVEHEPTLELRVPDAGADIAGFRIVDLGRDRRDERDGRVIDTWWYQLRADLVGSYIVPPTEIAWRPEGDEEAEWTVLETSALFIEVASVMPEDGSATDIRDIKDLEPPPPTSPWVWAGLAGGLVSLALLGWGLRRWRRPTVEPPPTPPHTLAFAALDRLRQTDFADQVAVRAYYFSISEVLRSYIEGRFGLNATDLTTEEILGRMAGELTELKAPEQQILRDFLAATDRVKYAAAVPGEAEIEQAYEHALGFVEATQARPEPTQTEGA